MEKKREQWGSRIGFILASAGSAVGLGNIWKFPGKAYEGGGSAFLLVYLGIVLLIGVPVMITEFSLGRKCQTNTVGIFRKLDKRFAWVGWIGVIVAFIILCYYGHVGGWVLRYIVSYMTESSTVMNEGMGYFYKLLGYNAATETTFFPWIAIIAAFVFMAMNAIILIKGVSGGIEKFNKIGMPALFIILLILLIRTLTLPGSAEGLKYLITPDFSKMNGESFISALGQVFYSLSLGMAIMTTYGSYLSKKEDLSKNTFIVCGLDTTVAFMAGFIVVPAVFATLGADSVGKGGGFAFGALGGVFKAMPAGAVFGCLFYMLLFFAAITSSISIAEGIIAFVCEEFHTERKATTLILCAVCFAIGVIYTISQAAVTIKLPWFDINGFNMIGAGDWMEYLTDRLLLPICAFGEAIFVGWVWGAENVIAEVEEEGIKMGWKKLYAFCIKYLCPVGIAAIIIYSFVLGKPL
ncbi:MAG TPA: sodium-dependent transporter [Bacillota bacterium]|nr:sodium-dependent transporter [Bacillota bacterium]